MAEKRRTLRTLLVVALALVLVAGVAVVGVLVWRRLHRTGLEQALDAVPAESLRVAYTDWSLVRRELGEDPGRKAGLGEVEDLVQKAYDSDFAAASSIDESAVALQRYYGFSPATATWEAYAQSRDGAAMVLKLPDGTDFDELADHLRSLGYRKPKDDDGVWKGGVDLVAGIDPTITPELQHVALLADQGLVVSSDDAGYAAKAAAVASGDGEPLSSQDGIGDLSGALPRPVNALVWAGDFACSDLAMSSADQDAQDQADQLVREAGGVDPLTGLVMSMSADRSLQVVADFADDDQARDNLRPRAKLAVGEAVGRGGSFSDQFRLTSSKAVGRTVRLVLAPRDKDSYVLSALYDGPVLFATC